VTRAQDAAAPAEPDVRLASSPKMVDVFSDVEIDTALATNPAGVAIAEMADANPHIVTLTADLGAVLADFRERHPERYLELGIAETNSVSVAAGLATCGYLPYIYSMAPFGILKCAEQIRTDLAYNHLPVRLVGRLTGLAMGIFGTSHHAVEDVAIARTLTNMTVIAPADSYAVVSLMRSTEHHRGPIYIRISEGAATVYAEPPTFEFGRWLRLRAGADVSLIGHGMGVGLAVRAADELATRGVQADVYDAAFLKPFDQEAIVDTARRTGAVLTIEDHNEVGGLASIVAETLGRHGLSARVGRVALPDEDLEVGVPADLYEYYKLTPAGVVTKALELTQA
jgi:transketolase